MTIRLCVVTLVLNPTGHILLVRNRKRNAAAGAPVWELPGGGMNHDEGILHAASREVFEETRCHIYGARLEDVILGLPKPGAEYRSVIFVVHAAGEGTVFASDDAIEAAWFKKDELPRLSDLDSAGVIARWAGKDLSRIAVGEMAATAPAEASAVSCRSNSDFSPWNPEDLSRLKAIAAKMPAPWLAAVECLDHSQRREAYLQQVVQNDRGCLIDTLKAQLKSREDRLEAIDGILGRVSNFTTEARASYVMNELAQALKEVYRLTEERDAEREKRRQSILTQHDLKIERDQWWQKYQELYGSFSNSLPLLLHCPLCNARHIDSGEYATKPHHTHACQSCGHCWRPAVVNTVGVQFLPGFKDENELSNQERDEVSFAEKASAPKFAGFVGAKVSESNAIRSESRFLVKNV